MERGQAHVGVASVNQTVGDWAGNLGRMQEVVHAARARGVRFLLMPEMCVSGYSLGDRLLRLGTMERAWAATLRLAECTQGMAVAVGLPLWHDGVVLNAMALLADGRLAALVAKENLATGDVEYENRYFQPWTHGRLVEHRGFDGVSAPLGTQLLHLSGLGTLGFEICEDAWKGLRPGSVFALAGAEILANPSASWFCMGKHQVRRRMVTQISHEDHCVYLYASLLGCDATRLVFDGSTFIAANGQVLSEGRRFLFTESWDLVDRVIDLREIRQVRMEEGSWREQHTRLQSGAFGPEPVLTRVEGYFGTEKQAPAPAPYWVPSPAKHLDPSLAHLEDAALVGALRPEDLCHLELELAICLGLRDYVAKAQVPALCLALSGGRDSAMVALLVHRMLCYEHPGWDASALAKEVKRRFICAYLATENSGPVTRAAAAGVAAEIGAHYYDGNVQPVFDATLGVTAQMLGYPLDWQEDGHDVPLQNMQARLRSLVIWSVANLHRALLLVTSNKSEAAVGYTTMDGDSSGGLAPIADVPKSLVTLWLAWARGFHGYASLDAVLVQEATAELRPPERAQTDEADLMPFVVLDQLMFAFVQLALEPLALLQRLWPSMQEIYGGDLAAFARDVRKFVRLLCQAQWKRERFAISFRVSSFDLDPKTGFRFPPVQAPFTEELEAMDRWVSAQLG